MNYKNTNELKRINNKLGEILNYVMSVLILVIVIRSFVYIRHL